MKAWIIKRKIYKTLNQQNLPILNKIEILENNVIKDLFYTADIFFRKKDAENFLKNRNELNLFEVVSVEMNLRGVIKK